MHSESGDGGDDDKHSRLLVLRRGICSVYTTKHFICAGGVTVGADGKASRTCD